MSSTVLFVPSPQVPFNSHAYDSLAWVFWQHGYNSIPAFLNWNTTPWDWGQQLEALYSEHDPEETILAGHWFGAMVALLGAAKRNPKALWLFSLPPFFHEDLINPRPHQRIPQEIDLLVMADPEGISFSSNAPFVQCPTLLFVGSEESQAVHHRAREALRFMPNAKRIVAPGSSHIAITKPHSSYLACIDRSI